jgi:hypothetical protein
MALKGGFGIWNVGKLRLHGLCKVRQVASMLSNRTKEKEHCFLADFLVCVVSKSVNHGTE